MRKLLLVILFTAIGMGEGLSQTLIQAYTDRCTGETTVFSVPLNGQTVVTFYNRSRSVSSADIYNGSFQAWLEETYQWWAALSPCSTTQAATTQTQQQTQQTAQDAAQAATNAAATTNVPETTTVPPTSSPPPTNTGTNETATTNTSQQNTSQTQSTGSDNSTQGGDNSTQGGDTDNTNTDNGQTGDANKSGGDDQSSGTESTSGEESTTQEEDTQTSGEDTDTETETESENEPVEESTEEESTEEESTEEESTEEESTEEEQEEMEEEKDEGTEEESEEESEEEPEESDEEDKPKEDKKKKKKKKNLAPPIISANVLSQQDLFGDYSFAMNIGVSRSSLMGDKTYSLNTQIFQNLKQFSLSLGFSKVFLSKGRPKWVLSTNLNGSRIFANTMTALSQSIVHLGKKGSVTGLSVSGSSLWMNNVVKEGMLLYDDQVIGMSVTSFYTKPFKLNRLSVSPMIAASYGVVSNSQTGRVEIPKNKDVMFIVGSNFNYTLTKRFNVNFGSNVIKSTAKDFPYLVNFTIGSRFSF